MPEPGQAAFSPLLTLILLLPLLAAAVIPIFTRGGKRRAALAAGATTVLTTAILLSLARTILSGRSLEFVATWLPQSGLTLALRLDALGLLFGALVLLMGVLVVVYAGHYLSGHDNWGRFFSLLMFFMGSMLGIVLADNVLLLYVFWELTTLSSFLLIGYWYEQPDSRRGARIALTVTAGGGLALLAGLLLLAEAGGTMRISELALRGDQIRSHPLYVPVLLLVGIGAFAKSAQFPLHFWLPEAMAAPTPVSAYLHSATMVKAGVFLLARLFPALSGTDIWFYLVGGVGFTTMIFGAYFALFRHDLKGLLAYSTVSHLGLITLLFGLGTALGAVAALFHVINHAIFKASLFMAAGVIEHETHTRDMRRINGLFRYMPYTAVLAILASASMAGVPLLNGFLSKEMFFAEAVHQDRLGRLSWLEPAAAAVFGILSVAYSLRFIHDVFFNGEPVHLPRHPSDPGPGMLLPIVILVLLVVLVGMAPHTTVEPLLRAAAGAIAGPLPAFHLEVWQGWTAAFSISMFALAGGAVLYFFRHRLFAVHGQLFPPTSAPGAFAAVIGALVMTATQLLHRVEKRSLQRYVGWFFAAAAALAALGFVEAGVPMRATFAPPQWNDPDLDMTTAVTAVVLAVSSVAVAAGYRHRVRTVVMLGVAGLAVVLTFERFSGPDVALTQLCVEVVSVVLLLLALYYLPRLQAHRAPLSRPSHATVLVLSGVVGAGTTLLVWSALSFAPDTVADYYMSRTGGGDNIVNRILVDYRGFDTLGEITVLAIAAAGIFAVFHGRPLNLSGATGPLRAADAHPLVLATLTPALVPIGLLVSVFFLLRGHNLPGGGFIAALVMVAVLILQDIARGSRWTDQRLRLDYLRVAAAGLALATVSGAASVLFGAPFLTSGHVSLEPGWLGHTEITSTLVFDTGVYVAVVGSIMFGMGQLGRLRTEGGG